MILFSLSVSHRVFYNLTVKTRPITMNIYKGEFATTSFKFNFRFD